VKAVAAGLDDARLRSAFLEEAEELVQKLGETLSALEAAPEKKDLINEVFRLTHSLKSEAALMGYASLSGLGHAMEDVLGMARDGELALGPETLARLTEGADRCAMMMGSISQGGTDSEPDPGALIRELSALVGEGAGPATGQAAKGRASSQTADAGPAPGQGAGPEESPWAVPAFDEVELRRIAEARDRGESFLRLTVTVTPDEPMKFARAFLVFSNLEQAANVIRTAPGLEEGPVDDALYARTVFYLTSPPDHASLETAARVDQIDSVSIEKLDFPGDGSRRSPAPGRAFVDDAHGDGGTAASAPPVPSGPVERTSIRVDTRKLDELWTFVAELVLHKSHISRLSEGVARGMDAASIREELTDSSDSLEKISSGMQQAMRDTRMIPISVIFNKFPRLVRDLSRKLGKPVDLALSGEETEIDRGIVEALSDPLTHIIRNSLDHGLEFPEERVRLGKPDRGKVSVSARRQGGTIVIELTDDGRGLDTGRIREKAVSLGIPNADSMSEAQLRELVFLPGFSTKEVVTDLSGRGVGMDVVATRIRDLKGDVELESEPGRGTRIILRLPLTLTIVNSLLVTENGQLYAVPLTDLDSTAKVAGRDITLGERGEVWPWMGESIPLYSLAGMLGRERPPSDEYFAVVLRHGAHRGVLLVDELIEEREIVIRPVDDLLNTVRIFSGVSVLEDGRLVFILDTSFIRGDNF
jgi:two-component system chemotaxis sensor kinase CheA